MKAHDNIWSCERASVWLFNSDEKNISLRAYQDKSNTTQFALRRSGITEKRKFFTPSVTFHHPSEFFLGSVQSKKANKYHFSFYENQAFNSFTLERLTSQKYSLKDKDDHLIGVLNFRKDNVLSLADFSKSHFSDLRGYKIGLASDEETVSNAGRVVAKIGAVKFLSYMQDTGFTNHAFLKVSIVGNNSPFSLKRTYGYTGEATGDIQGFVKNKLYQSGKILSINNSHYMISLHGDYFYPVIRTSSNIYVSDEYAFNEAKALFLEHGESGFRYESVGGYKVKGYRLKANVLYNSFQPLDQKTVNVIDTFRNQNRRIKAKIKDCDVVSASDDKIEIKFYTSFLLIFSKYLGSHTFFRRDLQQPIEKRTGVLEVRHEKFYFDSSLSKIIFKYRIRTKKNKYYNIDVEELFKRKYSLKPDYYTLNEKSSGVSVYGHFRRTDTNGISLMAVKNEFVKNLKLNLDPSNKRWKVTSKGDCFFITLTCDFYSRITMEMIKKELYKKYDLIDGPWLINNKKNFQCEFLGFKSSGAH